jgi:hypothetical protein
MLRAHLVTSRGLTITPSTSPPAVSRDLQMLRVARLLDARPPAHGRTCIIRRPERPAVVDAWIDGARAVWQSRLDSLHIEISNGRKTG